MCRFLGDGNIEFMGRIDTQVKIRGMRIEVGEVEAQLLRHEAVKEAVVLVREQENGEKILVAYIVPHTIPLAGGGPAAGLEGGRAAALREYLASKLPSHMVPSFIIQLDTFPLTVTGKIDRKALPQPGFEQGREVRGPRDEIEETLARLWAGVLGVEGNQIDIGTSFFNLGGHSLSATTLVYRVRAEFAIDIPLANIFLEPTIRQQAAYIRKNKGVTPVVTDDHLVLLQQGKENAPFLFAIHDGTGEIDAYVELSHQLKENYQCWGLRASREDGLAPRNESFASIAQSYLEKIGEIQPTKPYHIAGWSLGGLIAYEMTAQLERQGEKTQPLILIDAPPPFSPIGETPGRREKENLEFTLESELDFITRYAPVDNIKDVAGDKPDIQRLWDAVAHYLEAEHYDVEKIKQAIIGYEAGMHVLPNFAQLDIWSALYYLNISRTFRQAHSTYIPQGKIQAPIVYIAAAQSREQIDKEKWQDYAIHPITFHEIAGDHFSIFVQPQVKRLAEIFEAVLKKQ